MERQTYSLAEAAEILGINVRTAQRLVADRRFPVPVLSIGARYRVSRVVLERYLAGDQQEVSA